MTITKKFPDPINEIPAPEELEKRFTDKTGCNATDGCSVEIDGICEHGYSSLRHLGFVSSDQTRKAIKNPDVVKMYSVTEVHGVYADAFVTDRAETLLFGSFWGRDTSIQELLARLSLPLSEGGLSRLRLVDQEEPSRPGNASIGNADRLAKLSGRMPKSSLFGELVQIWLYDRQAAEPDFASRRALRICRSDTEDPDPEGSALNSDLTWNLFREVCPLPLLDDWRKPVLNAARQNGWVMFHPGVKVNALALHLGHDEFEPTIEAMIQDGTLPLQETPPESNRPELTVAAIMAAEDVRQEQSRLTSEQLDDGLRYFTGTTVWFRHGLIPEMTYTEGVKFFAENGGDQGAYWFLDVVATEAFPLLKREPFLSIALTVKEGKAELVVEDGNGRRLHQRSIEYSDLQPGEWRFYLTDNVLLLPSEY